MSFTSFGNYRPPTECVRAQCVSVASCELYADSMAELPGQAVGRGSRQDVSSRVTCLPTRLPTLSFLPSQSDQRRETVQVSK